MVDKKSVIELYSQAAVFCCPSIYEPFGIINLEAMACETAVVATVLDEPYKANVRGTGIFVKRDGKWHIAGVHVGPDTGGTLVDDSKMKAEQEKK